jgi:hypothetical protein
MGVNLSGTNGQCDGNRVEGNTIWGTTGEGATYGIRTVSTTGNFILKTPVWGMYPTTAWTPMTLLEQS